jgi:ABC-type multidrug transport system ATPase subunit
MSLSLVFDNVGRRFGKCQALVDFNLVCEAGVMTSLIGPNGAGKSTALAVAAALLAPSSGHVRLNNREIRLGSGSASTGYLPQNSMFHRHLRVEEVIDFTFRARQTGEKGRREALEVTGLSEVLERSVGELSGGWVRRLGLMTSLAGSPELLLLDEPFVGLDPETHDRVLAHLRQRIDSGTIVVVASHDFEALDELTPSIVVLDEGRLQSTTATEGKSSRVLYRQTLMQKVIQPEEPTGIDASSGVGE